VNSEYVMIWAESLRDLVVSLVTGAALLITV
jgi:hypothetical protein